MEHKPFYRYWETSPSGASKGDIRLPPHEWIRPWVSEDAKGADLELIDGTTILDGVVQM